MHRDGGILDQVARLAGRPGGAKIESAINPESPNRNGMRAAIGTGGANPIITCPRQPTLSMAEGEIVGAGFEPV